jgi:LysM repeat protein
MKIYSLLATLLMVSVATHAQTKTYLYYDASCIHRLEYRHANSSSTSTINTYSLPRSNGEILLMETGLENAKRVTGVPKQMIRCDKIGDIRAFAQQINQKKNEVFIIRKHGEASYSMTPVSGATYVRQNGDQYHVEAYNYGFNIDAQQTPFDENIASGGYDGFIFLKSRDQKSCLNSFMFSKEPNDASACGEGKMYEFAAGIGILSELNSTCITKDFQNGMLLHSVDDIPTETYISQVCEGSMSISQAPRVEPVQFATSEPITYAAPSTMTAKSVAPVQYNTSNSAAKAGKLQGRPVPERTYIPPAPTATVVVNNEPMGPPKPKTFYCSSVSSYGYHVVEKGETLYSISRQYNIPVKDLTAWNKLKNANQIELCQTLRLSAPPQAAAKPAVKSVPVARKKAPALATSTKKSVPKQKTSVKPLAHSTSVATAKPKAVAARPVIASPKAVEVAPVSYAYTGIKSVDGTSMRSTSILHTVQSGETMFGLSKMYGYSTERFALMNGLTPQTALQPGQQLVTSDCSCPIEKAISAESLGIQQTPKSVEVVTKPTEYAYYKQPVESPNANKSSTVTYSTVSTQEQVEEVPSTYTYETQVSTEPVVTEVVIQQTEPVTYSVSTPIDKSSMVEYRKGVPIKTHTVMQGDSIEVIAKRYKTSPAQLRIWNQLEENEVLVNGQLLIVQR